MTTTSLTRDVDELLPGIIADRRWLHAHPELSLHETETARFVVQRLEALGVADITTGWSRTGVSAQIHGTAEGPDAGKVVFLRADIDALPIQEETGAEYASETPGVMHACGHDGHTAMLLAAARLLMERRDQFAGTVKLLFQPCEEHRPGGASWTIDEGILENPHVDAVFGLHLAQSLPVGTVSAAPGPVMAAGQFFKAKVQGRGGHGAAPHLAADPVVAAAAMIMQLQTIVSRNVDPLATGVLTVGLIHGGTAVNVIPDTVEFGATMRSFSDEGLALIRERAMTIIESVATSMGVTVEIELSEDLSAVVNDPEMAALVRRTAAGIVGEEHAIAGRPWMASEDFAYFLKARPGCFFWVGCRNEEKGFVWDHHHPKFDFDEEALGIGASMLTQVALDYLAEAE